MKQPTLPAWLDKATVATLGVVTATAVLSGLGAGQAFSLPRYLAEPIRYEQPDLRGAEDPNQAQWQAVIASLGGIEATRVISSAYVKPLPLERVAFYEDAHDDLYQRLDALEADLAANQPRHDVRWDREPRREEDYVAAQPQARLLPAAFQEAPAVRVYQSNPNSEASYRMQPVGDEPTPPPVPVPSGW